MQLGDNIRIFDKRAGGYEDYSSWCKDEGLYRLCTEPLVDMVPSIWCLDLACGTGAVGRRNHAETGRRWVLLDLSRAMALSSPAGTSVPFIQGDAAALPFADGVFGHIVIRSALQFVDAPRVVREACRVISSRGHFVVVQKTRHEDPSDRDWHDELFRLRNVTARQDWTEEGLIEGLRKGGFRVLRVQQYRERRQVELERWIRKDGTVPPENVDRIRRLILNPPGTVIEATNQTIKLGVLQYDRIWSVVYCRKETVRAPLTPAVFSMIVQREVNGERSVLLQRRRKRYEEPDYVDSWELPQGKLERGVSGAETIRQELYDETGLRLTGILGPSKLTNSTDPSFVDSVEIVTPIVAVRSLGGTDFLALAVCVTASGEPMSRDIDRSHTWVPVEELRQLLNCGRIFPLNRPMLVEYLRLLDDASNFRAGLAGG